MDDITYRIGKKLKALFPGIAIYSEDIQGGFEDPSFSVQFINMTPISGLFNQQKRVYRYDVVYFPKDNSEEDARDIQDSLAWNFKVIDDVAHLTERDLQILKSEPPNVELHFTFAVEVHVKAEDGDKFYQDLDLKGGLK